MSLKNEPAFPGDADAYNGMSLLDYFAAKAMHAHQLAYWQHWYSIKNDKNDNSDFFDDVEKAEIAYDLAIAMIDQKNDMESKTF
jgi:hypothetical protein